MRGGLVVIECDLFDIALRLKEIDAGYVLVRNVIKNRFEIYKDGAIQVVSPFPKLDARLIEHVRATRVENAFRLLKELDSNNERRETEAEKNAANRTRERVREVINAC